MLVDVYFMKNTLKFVDALSHGAPWGYADPCPFDIVENIEVDPNDLESLITITTPSGDVKLTGIELLFPE